jgi:ADP-heptose:LPS heptosyltransferase
VSDGILVARLDNAGDVLLAGPAVRAAAATGRPVHLLCGPRGRAAADLLPGVTRVIEWHTPWIEPERMAVEEEPARDLVSRVRAATVADAALLGSSHQSPLPLALLLRWAGVGRIAAVSHDHAGSLLDVRIPGDPDVHEVRRSLLVTEALGLRSPADDRLRVDLGTGALPSDVAVTLAGKPYVVIHPGASVPARTLTPQQWAAIALGVSTTGRSVIVTGGREETRLTEAVRGDQPGVTDLGGRLTLRQLGRVLAGAAAVVCGNTGPMHLAAAVGTPVVASFAPTVPLSRWCPWRVPHVVLGDQAVACAGCRARTCPRAEQVCVSGVSAADVLAALDRLLDRPAAPAVGVAP